MNEDFGPHPHAGKGWRPMAATALILALAAAASQWMGALFFGLMCLVMATSSAFLAGYLYRQQVLNSGLLARFKMFRLREDRDGP